MQKRYGTFQIFAEAELRDYLEQQLSALKQDVYSELPEYLLNVIEDQYIEHLVNTYSVESLAIDFSGVSADSHEEQIPAEYFPSGFDMYRGKSYAKPVICYYIPFSGNPELLKYAPSNRLMWSTDVAIKDSTVCFEIIDFSGDAEAIKRSANQILGNIENQFRNLAREIEKFNEELRAKAAEMVRGRRQQLQAQQGVLASLGVPIRKASSIPETFVVPVVRKKVIQKPPATTTRKDVPVPAIDPAIYDDILKTIYEMGKVFERFPSTYAGKDEEALRDHLILQLEPRFEGSTTGETFNKKGKTDILIRHEKNNIFVAECKFWGGKAQHFKTIDQILSYLTWRDSKTAIVYFVNRKEISSVLNEIRNHTGEHKCFVRSLGEKDPSWQTVEFHLPDDPGCKIMLTVLAFHIPG